MLKQVPKKFDKTEGSFFYDLLKPVALKLEENYKLTQSIEKKGFIDTAEDEFLNRKVLEVGLKRKEATRAEGFVKITGDVGAEIRKGIQVASDNLFFRITENAIINDSKEIIVSAECEADGESGNVPVGAIKTFPVTIAGLKEVSNLEAFEGGFNAESDEALRDRYYLKVRTPATSGNKFDYLNWAKEVVGVGDAKVISLWNGNGTVKVIIIDSNSEVASPELIAYVIENIENKRPIGATVTVESATTKVLNISLDLIIDSKNYNIEDVKREVEKAIKAYLKTLAFKADFVSYAKIGATIFNVAGVADYRNLLINNETTNTSIHDSEIPVLGDIIYV